MTLRPSHVSVLDPIGPAIERVKTVLFRPFDIRRWLIIGFCAWLAQLGQGGNGGGGGGDGDGGFDFRTAREEIRRGAEEAWFYAAANLSWLIPVVLTALVLIVAIGLLVLWLSSRGRFMFLDCVAQNKAEVVNPWHRFSRHANSLFLFRLGLAIVTFAVALVFVLLGGLVAFLADTGLGFNVVSIMGMVCCGVFFVATLIVSWVAAKFTKDFAVPIMYLKTHSAVKAWHVLLDVISVNMGRFFIYIVFQAIIAAAILGMMVAAMCLTCCCAACLFALPYIGTVVLLPIHVFGRSYSLYYLAQYGPEFDVFPPDVAVPTAEPAM